ncbi:hypothetical protein ABZX51_000185 [Aspergillus tubingensis]|uniref:GNAT family acetyltransferase n=1 Tax=Aspergillus tubingensis TaxID=5068 RepID=UPI0015782E84|nr:GNAT family acetyltransferase [Aspergillus tubingensis]GFN14123.1 GNAT family acetyltransferase [Aspergillus tubingensis]
MTQTVAASSVGFPQSLFSDRHQGPGARGSKGRNALTWSMVLLPENVASQHGYKMSISAALISQGGADPRNVLAAGATDNVSVCSTAHQLRHFDMPATRSASLACREFHPPLSIVTR